MPQGPVPLSNGVYVPFVNIHPTTYAKLVPGKTGVAGPLAIITDSNTTVAGANAAGSGANVVMVWWNGSHYVVLSTLTAGAITPASVTTNYLALTPLTFATLPGTPTAGTLAFISDGNSNTWGAAVTASGADPVLVQYNGTAWTVVGK